MISFITMAAGALGGLLVSALKAFFSLLSWFIKHFVNVLKYFYCALPLTAVIFVLLFAINIFTQLTGEIVLPENRDSSVISFLAPILSNGYSSASKLSSDLKAWWITSVYAFHGSVAYIFLMILTVLMFVPVVSVLLTISVVASYGLVLFYAVLVDAAVYLLRAVLGKTFIKQFLSRYFSLFKEAGKKHDEKSYEKWLRNHREEFEDDTPLSQKRQRREEFYEEDYLEEYDDRYEDQEDYDQDEYDEEDYDEEDYDEDFDEEYEDEDYEEDYEDDYDDPRDKKASAPASSFDFFAGCNSRESLDRKYKSLVKLYHPDNMDGDTSALQEINVQYDKAKKSGRFT